MLHPATAHFAMVLPVVASVFSLIYLVNKSETFSKITARATLIAALAMIGVWYTGNQAGPQIYDYLSGRRYRGRRLQCRSIDISRAC